MLEEAVELLTPWFLQSNSLNANEMEELARRRKMGPTVDRGTQVAGTTVGVEKLTLEKNMRVPTKVVERLGPYLKRVAAASAEHWKKAVDALGAKGIKVGSVDDLMKFIRENWMQTAVVLSTLASVGLTVGDLFTSEDKSDPEVRKAAIEFDQVALGVSSAVGKVAAASESLKVGVAENEINLATLQEICTWAKSRFGGRQGALEAHQMLQAFVELSYADLETGMRYLK